MRVYYLVYKLTNKVNGKIYIGCHMTKNLDDGYMGSGKRLWYAKKKYGIENFEKEILSSHETSEAMFAEEARLVNDEFLGRDDVYNLTCGGRGSWFLVNQNYAKEMRIKCAYLGNKKKKWLMKNDQSFRTKISNNSKLNYRPEKLLSPEAIEKGKVTKIKRHGKLNSWHLGSKRNETTKKRMSNAHSGSNNSQFDTCWIWHDLIGNKKCSRNLLPEFIEQGWMKGRKLKV